MAGLTVPGCAVPVPVASNGWGKGVWHGLWWNPVKGLAQLSPCERQREQRFPFDSLNVPLGFYHRILLYWTSQPSIITWPTMNSSSSCCRERRSWARRRSTSRNWRTTLTSCWCASWSSLPHSSRSPWGKARPSNPSPETSVTCLEHFSSKHAANIPALPSPLTGGLQVASVRRV